MSHEFDEHFIILPDGRLEPAKGRIPADCPVEAIVFPRVSSDLVLQAKYEMFRLNGYSHAYAYIGAARGESFLVDGLFDIKIRNRQRYSVLASTMAALGERELEEVSTIRPNEFARYCEMLADGQSHKFAIMLATRSFPGVKTDSIFNEGKFSGNNAHGCHEKELWLRKDAEKKGFSTNGMWYCSGLASFPGDPSAWVSGRGDVERVAREKNLNILEGYVTHKAHEVAPKPDIEIDQKLVSDEVEDIMDSHPGAKREDVYERVYNLRSGKVDPNPLIVQEPTQDWG